MPQSDQLWHKSEDLQTLLNLTRPCITSIIHILKSICVKCWLMISKLCEEDIRELSRSRYVRKLGADILRIFCLVRFRRLFAHVTPGFLTVIHRRHRINVRSGLYWIFSYANKFGEVCITLFITFYATPDLKIFDVFRVLVYVVPVVFISIGLNIPKWFETAIEYEPINPVDK